MPMPSHRMSRVIISRACPVWRLLVLVWHAQGTGRYHQNLDHDDRHQPDCTANRVAHRKDNHRLIENDKKGADQTLTGCCPNEFSLVNKPADY